MVENLSKHYVTKLFATEEAALSSCENLWKICENILFENKGRQKHAFFTYFLRLIYEKWFEMLQSRIFVMKV